MSHELSLTDSRPDHLPRFLREIEALADDIGFINAVHETLQRDNISVGVEGDFDRLKEHDEGILFVGDHKNQWEFVALMDMLSRMGRDDMINIAKFYVQRQIHQTLGAAASRLVLPVYPRILARDRGEVFNSETINRFLYRRFLLDKEESAKVNETAIVTSADFLDDGGVVNIFPCGSVVDARTHAWHTGVGRIIRQLPEEGRGDVLVAPYATEDIFKARLVGAVALRGRGIFGRPQSMDVEVGPLHTAEEIVSSLPRSDRDDPVALTNKLRQQFLDHFDAR